VAASEARQGYQNRSRGKKGSQKILTTIVVDNWSTPQARDWKGAQGRAYKGEAKDLPAQTEKNWATPQASDHIEGARTAKESNQKCLGRDLNQMENWPTPTGTERSGTNPQTGKGHGLSKAAKMNWPTPRAGNPGSRKPGTGGKILAEEAKKLAGPPAPEKSNMTGKNHGSWPTARSSDAEGGRIKTEKTEKGFRSKREKSDQYFGAKLRDAVEMEKPPTMKLNPNWVEQLMGLPVGWTQLPTEQTVYASSEMAFCQPVQN
jgi:hypothetical protein